MFNPSSWELRCRKIWLLHNLLVLIFPPKYKLSLPKIFRPKAKSFLGGARLSTYGGKLGGLLLILCGWYHKIRIARAGKNLLNFLQTRQQKQILDTSSDISHVPSGPLHPTSEPLWLCRNFWPCLTLITYVLALFEPNSNFLYQSNTNWFFCDSIYKCSEILKLGKFFKIVAKGITSMIFSICTRSINKWSKQTCLYFLWVVQSLSFLFCQLVSSFIISRSKFSMYRQDIGVDGSSIDSCFNIKERLKRIWRKGPEHCGYLIYPPWRRKN